MSAHTPGPWKLITGGPMLVTSDESAIIATRLGGVSEANARLIAAAPALAAALKALLEGIDSHQRTVRALGLAALAEAGVQS